MFECEFFVDVLINLYYVREMNLCPVSWLREQLLDKEL